MKRKQWNAKSIGDKIKKNRGKFYYLKFWKKKIRTKRAI